MDKVKEINTEAKLLQVNRVRQAWLGVQDAVPLSQRAKDRGEDEDLDKLLPKVQLESIATAHWDRYHILYPWERMMLNLCRVVLSVNLIAVHFQYPIC